MSTLSKFVAAQGLFPRMPFGGGGGGCNGLSMNDEETHLDCKMHKFSLLERYDAHKLVLCQLARHAGKQWHVENHTQYTISAHDCEFTDGREA